MVKLTQEMKEMITSQQCFVGTVDKSGMPNVAPKRSTRVLNDSTIIYSEVTGGTTFTNIQHGSKVTVAVVNRDEMDGFRFIGIPEIVTDGNLYDEATEISQKMHLPKPYAVIVIHIEEIHSLKPGVVAGKKIVFEH